MYMTLTFGSCSCSGYKPWPRLLGNALALAHVHPPEQEQERKVSVKSSTSRAGQVLSQDDSKL